MEKKLRSCIYEFDEMKTKSSNFEIKKKDNNQISTITFLCGHDAFTFKICKMIDDDDYGDDIIIWTLEKCSNKRQHLI